MKWLGKRSPLNKADIPDANAYPTRKPATSPIMHSTARAFFENAMRFTFPKKVDKASEP